MATILVPYHQDERLAARDIPVRADVTVGVVAFDVACPWWPTDSDDQQDTRTQLLSRLAALTRPDTVTG